MYICMYVYIYIVYIYNIVCIYIYTHRIYIHIHRHFIHRERERHSPIRFPTGTNLLFHCFGDVLNGLLRQLPARLPGKVATSENII